MGVAPGLEVEDLHAAGELRYGSRANGVPTLAGTIDTANTPNNSTRTWAAPGNSGEMPYSRAPENPLSREIPAASHPDRPATHSHPPETRPDPPPETHPRPLHTRVVRHKPPPSRPRTGHTQLIPTIAHLSRHIMEAEPYGTAPVAVSGEVAVDLSRDLGNICLRTTHLHITCAGADDLPARTHGWQPPRTRPMQPNQPSRATKAPGSV
ncbi:hypothetical protein Ssi02_50790 [Sinosporangium siamense]|uniref:Uncharacterized protein n=1 Tax=Sinosporangium siamense TaxID=1367973 RepID=A0A919V8W0_9ACTN|nr:hypothetical protein Ssi02_50790 [Sinosporangium siamense]